MIGHDQYNCWTPEWVIRKGLQGKGKGKDFKGGKGYSNYEGGKGYSNLAKGGYPPSGYMPNNTKGQTKGETGKDQGAKAEPKGKGKSNGTICYKCWGYGHLARDCPSPQINTLNGDWPYWDGHIC